MLNRNARMKQLRTVISRDGKHYFVSTNDTFDHGFETMIFRCDSSGKVTDWEELFAEVYDTVEEATNGHRIACESFNPKESNYAGSF